MAVSNQINKVRYVGNGIANEFPIPFSYLETQHLEVYQLLDDVQTQRTDFTVSGNTLIFQTAPALGAQIIILRNVPMTQDVIYQPNEIFHADTHEAALDKLTMEIQQLAEKMDRAITVDIFSTEMPGNYMPEIKQTLSSAASYAQLSTQSADVAGQQAEIATQAAQTAQAVVDSKANADLSNVSKNATKAVRGLAQWSNSIDGTTENRPAVVTESYMGADSWYRVWSNGWIEQGGSTVNLRQITFLKPFSGVPACVSMVAEANGNFYWGLSSKSATGLGFYSSYSLLNTYWYAAGY